MVLWSRTTQTGVENPHICPPPGANVTGTEADFYDERRSEVRRQRAHSVFNQRRPTTERWRSQNRPTTARPPSHADASLGRGQLSTVARSHRQGGGGYCRWQPCYCSCVNSSQTATLRMSHNNSLITEVGSESRCSGESRRVSGFRRKELKHQSKSRRGRVQTDAGHSVTRH